MPLFTHLHVYDSLFSCWWVAAALFPLMDDDSTFVPFVTFSPFEQKGKRSVFLHTSRLWRQPSEYVGVQYIWQVACHTSRYPALDSAHVHVFFWNLPYANSRDNAPLICYCSGGLHHHHLRCLSSASKLDTWEVQIRYSFYAIMCTLNNYSRLWEAKNIGWDFGWLAL